MKKILITCLMLMVMVNVYSTDHTLSGLMDAVKGHVNGNSEGLVTFLDSFSTDIVNSIDLENTTTDELGDRIVEAVDKNLAEMGIDKEGNVKISGDLLKSVFLLVDSQVNAKKAENKGFFSKLFSSDDSKPLSAADIDLDSPDMSGLKMSQNIVNKVMNQVGDDTLGIAEFHNNLMNSIMKNIDLSDTENMGENISDAVNKDVDSFLKGMGIDTDGE